MPGYDTNKGAKAARVLRETIGLSPTEPLACLLSTVEEQVGVPVALLPIAEGYAGAYLRRGDRGVVFVHQPDGIVRKRFSLGHELGHHAMGHSTQVDTWAGMLSSDRHPIETQANAFAAEFVAPKAGILAWWEEHGARKPTLEHVVRLSALYGLSCESVRYRLTTVGLMPDEKLAKRLDREIAAGEHVTLIDHLGLEYPHDGLAEHDGEPFRLPDGCAHADALVAALIAA